MDQLPELRTERLLLRQPSWRDIPSIVEFAGDRRIADTTATIPYPYAEKDAINWLRMAQTGLEHDLRYVFGLYLPEEEERFIGGMGLHLELEDDLAELGYWVAVPYWGRGYASEAAAAILRFGFETLRLNKVFARHISDNPASGRVLVKNGMTLEGELREHAKKNGVHKNLCFYGLLRKDYLAARQNEAVAATQRQKSTGELS